MNALDHDTAAPPAVTAEGNRGALAVQIENLTHTYAGPPPKPRGRHTQPTQSKHTAATSRTALDNVSFDVRPHELFGILGPNGGGKTTLFRVLSTLLRPTAGRLNVFGYDVQTQPDLVRQHLGIVFQMPSLDVKLTARENLTHQGRLYGLHGADLKNRVEKALSDAGLADRAEDDVESFSGGMRRKLELAKSLLHRPPLLLLDEPSTGLDVAARRDLWQRLEQLRDRLGVTIVFTTHMMDEAQRCDRLAILNRGRLVAIDTPADLKARIGGDVVTIEADADQLPGLQRKIADKFGPWGRDAAPMIADGKIHLEKTDGPRFVATLAQAFPGTIRSITVGQPTLEDVFMHITGQAFSEQTS